MNAATTQWFSPSPDEFPSNRISLDFGLRSADQYFRELVVPEIGRIWFVRQISWPLAALLLHEELISRGGNSPKPTSICHGIEALACKLEYRNNSDPETRSRHVLGSRAFNRDNNDEAWSFKQLHQAKNYVRNTHRQAATRALNIDGGLGFANGSRFDLLELEPIGRTLAETFLNQRVGQGKSSLRNWLCDWIEGDKEVPRNPNTLLMALSPENASNEEREIVRSRLFGTTTAQCNTRKNLAIAVGQAEKMRDIDKDIIVRLRQGHQQQAAQVIAARAFGALLDRSRDVVAALTCVMEHTSSGVSLSSLVSDKAIKDSIKNLRTAAGGFLKKAKSADISESASKTFATAVSDPDDSTVIKLMVSHSGDVLWLADSSITRGSLFRLISNTDSASDLEDGAISIEPDRTGRTFRIANFHALLREVNTRGVR